MFAVDGGHDGLLLNYRLDSLSTGFAGQDLTHNFVTLATLVVFDFGRTSSAKSALETFMTATLSVVFGS